MREAITLRLQDLHWSPWVPEGKFIHQATGWGASVVEGETPGPAISGGLLILGWW